MIPLSSLYALLRDAVKGLAALRARGLSWRVEVHQLGPRTRILVTARCRSGATRPVSVHGCRAERYETAFDSCVGPLPVRDGTIQFSPRTPVTVRPGELPQRWEAQFYTEYLRRTVREGNDAATARIGGEELFEAQRLWEQALQPTTSNPVSKLLRAYDQRRTVRIRVVLEVLDRRALMTRPLPIPPSPSLRERIRTAIAS